MLHKKIISRNAAAAALTSSGLDRALSYLGKFSTKHLTIFAYHRIFDVASEQSFASDIELVSASSEGFHAQMRFVRDNFTPITFARFLECNDAGVPPPPGSAIVTFDDGFVDNYNHAFPILKELGVPATIFVSTGYVDKQIPFWFEYLSNILLSTRRSIALSATTHLSGDASVELRRAALYTLLRQLKRVPDAERISIIQRIERESGIDSTTAYSKERLPLSWDQIREMSAAGIEFGSHTVNHPVLSQVDEATVRLELVESKLRIEAMIGKKVQVLSYPVGGVEAFDTRVRNIAQEAGYRLGVAYEPGGNRIDDCDRFALRRIRVERYVTDTMFRAMSVLPSVFAR